MSLKPFRRFTLIAIAVVLLGVIFGISGCSQLSKSESRINTKFSQLIPDLTLRYEKLHSTVTLTESIGGQRDITKEAKIELTNFSQAVKEKNIDKQISTAQELENIIGRLRATINSSPKLSESAELKTSINEVDKTYPGDIAMKNYYKAVDDFERKRQSWRFIFSSSFGGFNPPQRLELSLIPNDSTEK